MVQLNFADRSSVVYAVEQSQFMRFISELYIAVPAGERKKTLPSNDMNSLSVLLIQNHGIQRHLRIRGRDLVPLFSQDYYTGLVEEYYRIGERDEESQSIVAKLLANFTLDLPNAKLQLKLFFQLCTRIINIHLYLREKNVGEYLSKKTVKRNSLNNAFFKPVSPGKKMSVSDESVLQLGKGDSAEIKQNERLVETLYFLEDNMKLLNLMLGDKDLITELAANLFAQSESKIKVQAIRRLADTLIDLMELGNQPITRKRNSLLPQHKTSQTLVHDCKHRTRSGC